MRGQSGHITRPIATQFMGMDDLTTEGSFDL